MNPQTTCSIPFYSSLNINFSTKNYGCEKATCYSNEGCGGFYSCVLTRPQDHMTAKMPLDVLSCSMPIQSWSQIHYLLYNIMEESFRRSPPGETLQEKSFRRGPPGETLQEKSFRRGPPGEILGEESSRRSSPVLTTLFAEGIATTLLKVGNQKRPSAGRYIYSVVPNLFYTYHYYFIP
jgi:hypothetical protein